MNIRAGLLACCLISVHASGSVAQVAAIDSTSTVTATTATSSGWQCFIEPYFLLPTISGTSGIGGLTADIEADLEHILTLLDFAAMLHFEAYDPTWAVALDVMYFDLGSSATSRQGDQFYDLEQTGVILGGFRRVSPWAEVMAGLQLNDIQISLTPIVSSTTPRSADRTWFDPYLGARTTWYRDPWRFAFFAAVGGFGLGSDFAWQAFPQVGYRFGSLFEATAGFRAVAMDYQDGSGIEEFVYDLTTYGPQLGARFHF